MYTYRCYDTSHNDIQHNDTHHKWVICDTQHKVHNITTLCHYDECHVLFIIKQNFVMLSFLMLNVVMQSVVGPYSILYALQFYRTKTNRCLWYLAMIKLIQCRVQPGVDLIKLFWINFTLTFL